MTPWMYTLPTPVSMLEDLADMCEEAAGEMLEADKASDCARSYLKHVEVLANDVFAFCPNTLFGGNPIVIECIGNDGRGPLYRPIRALHDIVRHAVREINIDYGADEDVSEDFSDAASITRAAIARATGVAISEGQ